MVSAVGKQATPTPAVAQKCDNPPQSFPVVAETPTPATIVTGCGRDPMGPAVFQAKPFVVSVAHCQ